MYDDSSTSADHAQFSAPLTEEQTSLLRELERGRQIWQTAYRYVLLDGDRRVRNLRGDLVDGLLYRRYPLIERHGQALRISAAGRSALESETAR